MKFLVTGFLMIFFSNGFGDPTDFSEKSVQSIQPEDALLHEAENNSSEPDSLYHFMINGVDHSVFIKTKNPSNPLLVILHGGPGFSDFYLWQSYNAALEEHFTVVTYDQRGAGLSFSESIPASSMTYAQLMDDSHELIQRLKAEFKQEKVYLMGYSGGTILGVYLITKFPEDFKAFISVGQMVNGYKNEQGCLEYAYNQALFKCNQAAIAQLKPLLSGYPSGKSELDLANLKILRKWNRVFFGDFCEGTSMDEVMRGIKPHLKELIDYDLLNKGEHFSMHHLWAEIMNVKLDETHLKFQVPVYFMVGSCDYNTPFELTQEYYELIEAPKKKIFYFQNSGHYIPFVEPQKFNHILINQVLH